MLIGGSPCVYWSLARTGKYNNGIKRETKPEGYGWELFTQYLRALKEVKPKYFLYENNASMSDEIKDCISKELKCEPYEIDSADFSAQNRKRYYWTNIPILPYEKSTLLFCDIEDKEDNNFMIRSIEQYVDTIKWSTDGKCVKWDTSGKGYYSQQNRAKTTNQKWNTVCANRAESKGDVWLGNNMVRHLTMSEFEKLQTLPVGYTACLKNKEMRGKCIGNGWTVDVIAHIFKGLKEMNKMSKRFSLDNCILEVANKYGVTVNDLEDSIQELLYCALYCDYVPKCKLIVVEDYKTILTALGELAKIYNIRGELAAWVLIDLWEVLDEDKNLVECITNGKYFAKIQKAIAKYANEVN